MSVCIDGVIHFVEYRNIYTFHTLPLWSIIVGHQNVLKIATKKTHPLLCENHTGASEYSFTDCFSCWDS